MKITKHAQSCFLIEHEDTRILIDPGYFVFENENIKPSDFQNIKAIIFTHSHRDHFDLQYLKEIINLNAPIIFTNREVKNKILEQNLVTENEIMIISQNVEYRINGFILSGYVLKHGSGVSSGEIPINVGVLLKSSDFSFFHPGDTIELRNDIIADIIAIPLCGKTCGRVVFRADEAKTTLLSLPKPPHLVIPMHYDNDKHFIDPRDFIKIMEGSGVEVKILNNGETLEL